MQAQLLVALLAAAPLAEASGLGLLVSDEAASSPRTLMSEYAKRLSSVGQMIPKDTLREHIRRDFMPRMMGTQDDRAAYELAQETFQKLSVRSMSLVELGDRISSGEKISNHDALERQNLHKEVARDIQLLTGKIRDMGKLDCDCSTSLQLLANSVKNFACAIKHSERSMLIDGLENPNAYEMQRGLNTHNECKMPFPGSLIFLGQQITVPEKTEIPLPHKGDPMAFKPHQWIEEHLRRTVWCPESFRRVGFGSDAVCDAVASALDMPRPDEFNVEHASLLQLKASKEQGDPMLAAATVGLPAGVLDQQDVVVEEKPMSIKDELAANLQRFQQLEQKKLSLAKKRQELTK